MRRLPNLLIPALASLALLFALAPPPTAADTDDQPRIQAQVLPAPMLFASTDGTLSLALGPTTLAVPSEAALPRVLLASNVLRLRVPEVAQPPSRVEPRTDLQLRAAPGHLPAFMRTGTLIE